MLDLDILVFALMIYFYFASCDGCSNSPSDQNYWLCNVGGSTYTSLSGPCLFLVTTFFFFCLRPSCLKGIVSICYFCSHPCCCIQGSLSDPVLCSFTFLGLNQTWSAWKYIWLNWYLHLPVFSLDFNDFVLKIWCLKIFIFGFFDQIRIAGCIALPAARLISLTLQL